MPFESRITTFTLDRCRELGFALAGVCDAAPTSCERELIAWLAAGKHGEMEYLNRNTELRIDPREMVPGAKSIICVADRYAAGEASNLSNVESSRGNDSAAGGNPQGKIARYARGDDYHIIMKKRLRSLCDELQEQYPDQIFRACVDTAPVLEREHAQRAGLGAIGKNTLLLQRGVGSYLLLGEIITTLPLAASAPAEPDPCSSCTRCIDACPTDAITPWSLDATRCISYLTIEHRGLIDQQYHSAMNDWIFGCDICQEVCPHNQPSAAKQDASINVAYSSKRDSLDLLGVLNWDEQARRDAFIKSSMKRAKLDMMKRNAVIAAGNALRRVPNQGLYARVIEIASDPNESELVRQTAGAVANSIGDCGITIPGTRTAEQR